MQSQADDNLIPSFTSDVKPVRKRRNRDIYAENPFMQGVVIRTKDKRLTIARGLSVVDKEGEFVAEGTVTQLVPVDDAKFVKVYVQNIAGFFDLGKPGLRMLGVFLNVVQENPGRDRIVCPYEYACEVMSRLDDGHKLTRPTYDRGVGELIERQIIAPATGGAGFFFINPAVLFNGDRAKFMRVIVKRSHYNECVRRHKLAKNADLLVQALLPGVGPGAVVYDGRGAGDEDE